VLRSILVCLYFVQLPVGCLTTTGGRYREVFAFIVKRFRVFRAPLHSLFFSEYIKLIHPQNLRADENQMCQNLIHQ
ncbi:hypothetical protein AB2H13_27755, partial (plasmid) [Escherichia coli]